MKVFLRNQDRCFQGQVLKSIKGKFDEEITPPPFLVDTSHQVKFSTDLVFVILNDTKAYNCRCTKADSL